MNNNARGYQRRKNPHIQNRKREIRYDDIKLIDKRIPLETPPVGVYYYK